MQKWYNCTMKTIKLNNFFSESEINYLKNEIKRDISSRKIIYDKNKPDFDMLSVGDTLNVHEDLGRVLGLNINVSSVLPKVLAEVLKLHPDAKYSSSRYIEYSKKWGNGRPSLPMHKDSNIEEGDTSPYELERDASKTRVISFDYHLESNTHWPIIVEEEEFNLSDNDALLMYPEKQIHGRPNKQFKDNEYLQVIILSFTYNI